MDIDSTKRPRRFNSRTLGRVRRKPLTLTRREDYVSIHAPWEGCDGRGKQEDHSYPGFQFTHPGKGATTKVFIIDLSWRVSIHAPWEGCDSMLKAVASAFYMFQFTHPGKGATDA